MKNQKIYIAENGKEIECFRVKKDINGNPRYVIHYSDLDNDYDKALQKSRMFGGKAYRASSFSEGIVFSSYNLKDTFEGIEFNEQ